MKMISDSSYDFLNALVRYILPAFGTLYVTISAIWGLPYSDQVAGTTLALATFFGLVIGLARRSWVEPADGTVLIDEANPERNSFGFDDGRLLEDFANKDVIRLRVKHDGLPYVDSQEEPGL